MKWHFTHYFCFEDRKSVFLESSHFGGVFNNKYFQFVMLMLLIFMEIYSWLSSCLLCVLQLFTLIAIVMDVVIHNATYIACNLLSISLC